MNECLRLAKYARTVYDQVRACSNGVMTGRGDGRPRIYLLQLPTTQWSGKDHSAKTLFSEVYHQRSCPGCLLIRIEVLRHLIPIPTSSISV